MPSLLRTTVPHAPTPPSGTTEAVSDDSTSTSDLYGPDRLFGPPLFLDSVLFAQPTPLHGLPATGLVSPPFGSFAVDSIFNHSMGLAPFEAGSGGTTGGPSTQDPSVTNPGQYLKDGLARDAANVTPGVDDTPYILFALDALSGNIPTSTRRLDDGDANTFACGNHSSFPYRHVPDDELGYYRPRSFARGDTSIGTASIKMPAAPSPIQRRSGQHYSVLHDDGPARQRHTPASPVVPEAVGPSEPRASTTSSLSTLVYSGVQPPHAALPASHPKDSWAYLDLKTFSPQTQLVFPSPTFRPAIMRPASLAVLTVMCLLMAAALAFSAIFSRSHRGLVEYDGRLYGAQFFLFRVLPQLLAVVIVLYSQSLASAIVRIHPFSRMQALEHPYPEERNGAIFDNLYPCSFLVPQITSTMPWRVWLPLLAMWLINFAVPLQSSLFSVITASGRWQWATVQGVAWSLFALYTSLAAALLVVLIDWHNRATGLVWDPRSIADFITLASNSNTMADYNGTELLPGRDDLRAALPRRAIDKLGYWTWRDGRTSGVWHGIGADSLDDAWLDSRGPVVEPSIAGVRRSWNGKAWVHSAGMSTGVDLEAMALSPHTESVRYRYLPWCLRDGPLTCCIVVSFVLLLALFIMSFLPSTTIKTGFLPRVDAKPTTGAFSAANFLYSFLPALLGQALFLLFSSLDLALRILQPWAELSGNAGGAQPEVSILADYAACLPLQGPWHAARNGHWRVAAVSLMATCFAFLPALAGGLFMAITVSTGEVRMVPNMALYAVVLVLLVLCFTCIVTLLPNRQSFRLPHAVACIAEILSFCANDDLMQEPAFKNAHTKMALVNQLGINSPPSARSRWIFATGTSGDDRRLGIRRVRRYTELTNRPSSRRPPPPRASRS